MPQAAIFFADDGLPGLQIADALFIGVDDGIVGGIHDAVKKLIDLLFDIAHFHLQAFGARMQVGRRGIPHIAEHVEREIEQPFGGLQIAQQRLERAFDLFLADGLAGFGAIFGAAHVVGVARTTPLRPAGGHGPAAAAARHKPAQREILVQVFARRRDGGAVPALLILLVGLKADKRFVLAFDSMNVPHRHVDVTRIELLREELVDPLPMDFALAILGPCGLAFKEALDLGHRGKAPARIAFQRLLPDGSQRLVAHQQLAVTGHLLEAVADRLPERPIAVHDAGFHLLHHLTAVLLALQLALRGKDGFDEFALRRVLELEVETFDPRTAHFERAA